MLVTGYNQASGRDAIGHRIDGYRLYGLDCVEGVEGYMPTSVFVPSEAFASFDTAPQELIGEVIDIKKDPYGRLCDLSIKIFRKDH